MTTLLYFAYGSNMLQERLVARVSSAKPVGAALLRGYRLDFAKVSTDGSGKGDLVPGRGDEVWGRLYEFNAIQKADLDKHEGAHYQFHEVVVSTDAGGRYASTYLANPSKRDPAKLPYDWYLALIVAGAMQGHLPDEYIRSLKNNAFVIDQKENRQAGLEAIDALTAAGMGQVLSSLRQQVLLATEAEPQWSSREHRGCSTRIRSRKCCCQADTGSRCRLNSGDRGCFRRMCV